MLQEEAQVCASLALGVVHVIVRHLEPLVLTHWRTEVCGVYFLLPQLCSDGCLAQRPLGICVQRSPQHVVTMEVLARGGVAYELKMVVVAVPVYRWIDCNERLAQGYGYVSPDVGKYARVALILVRVGCGIECVCAIAHGGESETPVQPALSV